MLRGHATPGGLLSGSLLILPLLAACPASAQQRAPFRIDRWTTDEGLPSHTVSDVVQTADGYLWIATAGGLVRFDGVRFETYTASPDGLPSTRVSGLAAGQGDTLWITTEDGHLVRFAAHAFTVVAGPGPPLLDVEQDGGGRVWVSRSPGLWRLDGDSLVLVHDIDVFFMTRSFTPVGPQLVRTAAGDLWVREDSVQRMLRVEGSRLEPGPASVHRAVVVRPSRGEVLFARSASGLGEVFDAGGTVVGVFRDEADATPRLIDRRGHLWVTTSEAIEVYSGRSARTFATLPLQPGERIGVMIEDAEGNVWATTGAHGLIRVQPLLFRVYGREDGFREDQVLSLSRGGDGSVLAVDRRWNVYRITPRGVEQVFEEGTDAAMEHAWGAFEDTRGTLWLGRGGGLPRRHFVEGRRARSPPIVLDLPSRALVTQFAPDLRVPGTFWLADRRVYRARLYGGEPALLEVHLSDGERAVRHILPARDGSVWVATSDGLGRIRDGAIHFYGLADGLPVTHVRAIHEDREGRIWIGTYGGGIALFDGARFHAVRQADGLFDDVVSFILEDDAGNLWMSGNRGVHRASAAELLEFVAGRLPRVDGVGYGRGAGIPNPEGSGWHAYRSPDGRMWFPTYQGVVVVDPAEALARDTVRPRVHVEQLRLRGRTLFPAAGEMRLEAGDRRIEFDFAGISLSNPRAVRYTYRLEPLDPDWIHGGDAPTTVYTNLKPGRYTFRVRAIGGGGAVGESAPVTFVVPARFYESGLIYLLGLLGLLGLAAGAYRLRMRRMRVREEALRRLVDQRTRALAEEKERAEDASATVIMQAEQLRLHDEAKTRFFTNASHELRTPLMLMLAPLQDLEDGRAGALSAQARERIDIAQRSGAQLSRLVDQLLNAARLEAGSLRIHPEEHDIVAFLRELGRGFELLAGQQGLEFVQHLPGHPIRCRFDPAQLTIVLLNLLGNAFKFTPGDGCVALHARQDEGVDGREIVVEVVDTGVGIAADHLPHVFERYYQVQLPELAGRGGLGLGLALTRELVELHGGSISAQSREGLGSTFTIRLPVSVAPSTDAAALPPAPAPAAPRPPAPEPPAAPRLQPGADTPTVLLVEDNTELRTWVRGRLEPTYRVLEAADGAAGLALAREVIPDVVISDVMMPVMDGETLCRAVRADPEISFVPIILLTARASMDARLAGLEGGADDYLAKPFDVRELLARVNNAIASRRRLRERLLATSGRTPAPRPPEPRGDAAGRALLQRVYAALADNIADEDFTIDRLAAAVAMSRATLYRRLQPLIDVPPMELIWRYRLEQAALWLRATDANISEIAYGVGFKSVPHFCTRFREQFGRSPSSWRGGAEAVPETLHQGG